MLDLAYSAVCNVLVGVGVCSVRPIALCAMCWWELVCARSGL